jgi:hypothetical protein
MLKEQIPMVDDRLWPQAGRERMILPSPIGRIGTGAPETESALVAKMDKDHVFMMGDNPALPRMPEKPTLLDFYRYRFGPFTVKHLFGAARRAMEAGQPDTVALACLLHDISNGCLIRPDHGYWSAQLIAPYVAEEVAWAVKYHQALRYIPDPDVGYEYPQSYHRFFGPDYQIPDYLRRDAEVARKHPWYMTARLVTMYDLYFFDDQSKEVEPEYFAALLARSFRQPPEGLGFDGSPSAHMWRTMIWPNNFL